MGGNLIMAKLDNIEISENDRAYLESLLRARTMQAQIVQRARIMLLTHVTQRRDFECFSIVPEMQPLPSSSLKPCRFLFSLQND